MSNRDDILAVAVRLYSQRSFHDVSLLDIAHESQKSTSTLYRCFPKKRDIATAVYEHYFAEAVATVEAQLHEARAWKVSPRDLVVSASHRYRLHCETQAQLIRSLAEMQSEYPDLVTIRAAAVQRQLEEIAGFFAEFHSDGLEPRFAVRAHVAIRTVIAFTDLQLADQFRDRNDGLGLSSEQLDREIATMVCDYLAI